MRLGKAIGVVLVVVIVSLLALSYPCTESSRMAFVTKSPEFETTHSSQSQAVTDIAWHLAKRPEPGDMDPAATVFLTIKAKEKIPPEEVDEVNMRKAKPKNPRAHAAEKARQMAELKRKVKEAKREGFDKGEVIRKAQRKPGEEVKLPISDDERKMQREKIEGTGVTEKEVRATVVRLKGEIPSYVKLREADSPEEFEEPKVKDFKPGKSVTVTSDAYVLKYEGGMLYRDPRGRPYYIIEVTYPDDTTKKYWTRNEPSVIRNPSDRHRNLLVDINPEKGTIEFAPAKKKPPSRISVLEKVSLALDHLLYQVIP